jgi:WD40 repeat protein/serine/threonine protein kinase
MVDQLACPDVHALEDLVRGSLSDALAESVEAHIAECTRCAEILDRFLGQDPLAQALREQLAAVVSDQTEVETLIRRLKSLPAAAPAGVATHDAPTLPPAHALLSDTAREVERLLAAPAAADEIGRLGPYRVLRTLGAGGMGVVFEAEDGQLGRRVALKVIHPNHAGSPAARERFLREARALAALEHDHIVSVFQVGEERGILFLAMPLLKGTTLDARLARDGKLPVGEVLRIGRETAEGLAAAHDRGLVHRDIKPANIWLEGERGRVKLLDFGLARSVADPALVTQHGVIVGTPAYMAPEQADSKVLDGRCDLFSLGCVLYRCATGELPFSGADTVSMLLAVATQEPRPPCTLEPQLPQALSDLILHLLAKRPTDRPAGASIVAEALERMAEGQPVHLLPAPRQGSEAPKAPPTLTFPKRRLWTWRRLLAASIALLGLLVLTGYFLQPPRSRMSPDLGELAIDTTDPEAEVVIMQEGRQVQRIDLRTNGAIPLPAGHYDLELWPRRAPLWLSQDSVNIPQGGRARVQVSAQPGPDAAQGGRPPAFPVGLVRVLHGHRGAVGPVACSADGRRALSGDWEGTLRLWDLATGTELHHFTGHTGWVWSVAFSADGRRALSTGSLDHTVRLWDLDSRQEVQVVRGRTERFLAVAFTPDGPHAVSDGGGEDNTLYVWDISAGHSVGRLVGHTQSIWRAVFSADGRQLVSGSADQSVRLWDVASGNQRQSFAGHTGAVHGVGLSLDGQRVLSGSEDGTLRLWDVKAGTELRCLSGHTGTVEAVAFLPDGRHVLSGGHDQTVRFWDTETGNELARLEGHIGLVAGVAATPDGHWALSTGADGTVRLWKLPRY